MKQTKNGRRHLTLIHCGNSVDVAGTAGPITRLGLWQRFQPIPRRHLVLFAATKIAVIASIFYLWLRH